MPSNILNAYGTNGQVFTITLASLGTASARQSTVIDNTSNLFIDALVFIKIKVGTVAAPKAVNVYAIGTVDNGTTYTDNAGAVDAAITIKEARLIGVMVCDVNATTFYGGPFSVANAFGGVLPAKWGIIVENQTGASLDSTAGNHAALWQGVYETVG